MKNKWKENLSCQGVCKRLPLESKRIYITGKRFPFNSFPQVFFPISTNISSTPRLLSAFCIIANWFIIHVPPHKWTMTQFWHHPFIFCLVGVLGKPRRIDKNSKSWVAATCFAACWINPLKNFRLHVVSAPIVCHENFLHEITEGGGREIHVITLSGASHKAGLVSLVR